MPLTQIMGIVNVTPDSFSEDGVLDIPQKTHDHAMSLIQDGANILDIGAESTRPGATQLSHEQERERLAPVLGDIIRAAHQLNRKVSVDTRHPETAEYALNAGTDIINDVSGLRSTVMRDVLRNAQCGIAVMHARGIPADPSDTVEQEQDIIRVMKQWCNDMLATLSKDGFDLQRIILDPGIGFGKTAKQSLQLLACVASWRPETPVLIGHSRKSFLSLVSDKPASERDELTRSVSALLIGQGVEMLRVHDIAGHKTLIERLS